jgi:hypothetical protein
MLDSGNDDDDGGDDRNAEGFATAAVGGEAGDDGLEAGEVVEDCGIVDL